MSAAPEPDWPEREADMALIRRVQMLTQAAATAPPAEAARAKAGVGELMPAYAMATRRHNAALKRALAARAADGSCSKH